MNDWPAIRAIADDVKAGKLKAVDLVKLALQKIDETKEFDAIISTIETRAVERATEIDKNPSGRLAGVPFIAKDNFLTLGGKTTAASNILRPFEAPYQSTAIERLEAEGAICVAKANLDAFAHGSSTENSDWFVTKNPHDKTRVPGGSSGGSATAVVLNLVPFALGTDTGGSIRLPASFVGAVGVKPTYGRVSRSGVVAMASSTDVIGPLTKTVDDAALVLDVMSGKDELDSTTIDKNESYTDLNLDFNGKRFGLIKEYMDEGLDDGVRQVINESIEKLKQAGAQVEEVSLPSLPLALAVYYIVCPAEVSSNLSRYDGQRYGYSSEKATSLEESYELSREEGFGAEAKRRIMTGTFVLSSGYYDAYYKKAQIVRTKIIKEFTEAFKNYDFLIGPTSPTVAFKIGEKTADPLKMYLNDIMTVAANMSGNPAISVPAGEWADLPVGLQIIAPLKQDQQMLAAAKAFEGIR
jgi:aspartyl-tRNA(Asn)/glutamyl-tRNA(Gln) amidotransferase subunit A